MNIYAGNLSRDVTEEELRKVFRVFGEVSFVNIVRDRLDKTSVGFAFLGMPVQLEAEAAITGLKGKEMKGRSLEVNEARPREERRPYGGGGGWNKGGSVGRKRSW